MRVTTLGAGLRAATADNPGPLTLDGSRSYLVGSEETVLIDPGPAGSAQQEVLQHLIDGRQVRLVCLTHAHADHSGAARQLADILECPVAGSPDTLSRLDMDGRALRNGEELPVDGGASRLRVLTTPGHTRDHLSYLWLPGRELFTGDTVLGSGTSVIVHPDGEMGAYLASLQRLISARPAIILPGHGEPVETPVELLREYRAHRLEREAQIEAALDRGARSVEEIRDSVYGPLPARIQRAAEASIRAHLCHLDERVGIPAVEGYSDRDSHPLGKRGAEEA